MGRTFSLGFSPPPTLSRLPCAERWRLNTSPLDRRDDRLTRCAFRPHSTEWGNSRAHLQSQVGQGCRRPTDDGVGILAQL